MLTNDERRLADIGKGQIKSGFNVWLEMQVRRAFRIAVVGGIAATGIAIVGYTSRSNNNTHGSSESTYRGYFNPATGQPYNSNNAPTSTSSYRGYFDNIYSGPLAYLSVLTPDEQVSRISDLLGKIPIQDRNRAGNEAKEILAFLKSMSREQQIKILSSDNVVYLLSTGFLVQDNYKKEQELAALTLYTEALNQRNRAMDEYLKAGGHGSVPPEPTPYTPDDTPYSNPVWNLVYSYTSDQQAKILSARSAVLGFAHKNTINQIWSSIQSMTPDQQRAVLNAEFSVGALQENGKANEVATLQRSLQGGTSPGFFPIPRQR
jgi:hypothetical protein